MSAHDVQLVPILVGLHYSIIFMITGCSFFKTCLVTREKMSSLSSAEP